jgi:hypothetical protein
VSDLIDLRHLELARIHNQFKLLVEGSEEPFDSSREIVKDAVFMRLGLADGAIAMVCSRGVLVLTIDFALQKRAWML